MTSCSSITPEIEAAIATAADRVGAKRLDMRGYYLAGGNWDADTTDELIDLLIQCWTEQQQELGQ